MLGSECAPRYLQLSRIAPPGVVTHWLQQQDVITMLKRKRPCQQGNDAVETSMCFPATNRQVSTVTLICSQGLKQPDPEMLHVYLKKTE